MFEAAILVFEAAILVFEAAILVFEAAIYPYHCCSDINCFGYQSKLYVDIQVHKTLCTVKMLAT